MNPIRLLTSLFVLFTCLLAAQDSTQVVTHYRQGQVNERYWRNAAGEKHGVYTRLNRYGSIYISGRYAAGKPIGIWEFHAADSSARIIQRLDFDRHQELYIDSAAAPILFCGPRFFGGNMLQNEYIDVSMRQQFSQAERDQLKGKQILVAFSIDPKTLKPINVHVATTGIDAATQKKLIAIVSAMPAWLPPLPRAGTCVWEFSVPFLF